MLPAACGLPKTWHGPRPDLQWCRTAQTTFTRHRRRQPREPILPRVRRVAQALGSPHQTMASRPLVSGRTRQWRNHALTTSQCRPPDSKHRSETRDVRVRPATAHASSRRMVTAVGALARIIDGHLGHRTWATSTDGITLSHERRSGEGALRLRSVRDGVGEDLLAGCGRR